MEPIDGHGGVWEFFVDGGEEGGRHVADRLLDAAGVAAVRLQESLELLDRRLALAWRGENHRLFLTVRIDEHGDVILALFGGRLVEGEGSEVGEVETPQRLGDVVLDDPPQPLVGDADDPGHRQHWHLPHQGHRRLFEQKGEAAPLSSPRNRRPLRPMLRAVRPRNPGRDQTVMLEEVQVTPAEFLEVMRLATPAALRAAKFRPTLRLQQDLQDLRMLLHIKPLINKSSRRRNPEPKGQNIPRIHRRTLRSVQSQRRVADCALNHLLDSISGVEEPISRDVRVGDRSNQSSDVTHDLEVGELAAPTRRAGTASSPCQPFKMALLRFLWVVTA